MKRFIFTISFLISPHLLADSLSFPKTPVSEFTQGAEDVLNGATTADSWVFITYISAVTDAFWLAEVGAGKNVCVPEGTSRLELAKTAGRLLIPYAKKHPDHPAVMLIELAWADRWPCDK